VGHRILERSVREESTEGRGENSFIDPSERRLHPGRHKTRRHGLAGEVERRCEEISRVSWAVLSCGQHGRQILYTVATICARDGRADYSEFSYRAVYWPIIMVKSKQV